MDVNGIKLVAALQSSFDGLLADIDRAATYDEARMKGGECAGFCYAVDAFSAAIHSKDNAAYTLDLDEVVMSWICTAAQHMEDAARRTDASDIELARVHELREWFATDETA